MKYNVAILGGGPAGLSAGIFTTRAGLKTICFEKLTIGGQASLSHEIANYPGFENISGFDLVEKMFNHAQVSGVEFNYSGVVSLSELKSDFLIKTKTEEFTAEKVIIATGAKPRKLNIPGEAEFMGKGVSYCASCDGNFFKNKNVAVVGGGDSALEYVEYLCKICKKVYLINRSENFKAGEYKLNKAKKHKNLVVITSSNVIEVKGKDCVEQIVVSGKENGLLDVDGLFVAIGHEPDLSFLNIDLKTDKNGYIIVNEDMQTNIKNIFACGDIVSKKFKQVVTACADGAIAGNSCIGG